MWRKHERANAAEFRIRRGKEVLPRETTGRPERPLDQATRPANPTQDHRHAAGRSRACDQTSAPRTAASAPIPCGAPCATANSRRLLTSLYEKPRDVRLTPCSCGAPTSLLEPHPEVRQWPGTIAARSATRPPGSGSLTFCRSVARCHICPALLRKDVTTGGLFRLFPASTAQRPPARTPDPVRRRRELPRPARGRLCCGRKEVGNKQRR